MPDIPILRFTTFAKALSDPTRVRILGLLGAKEVCVCEIVDALNIPQSSLSTHLQALRQAGAVNVKKCSTWAYYSIEESYRPLIAALSSQFQWDSDPTLIEARNRLDRRLAMRECDCCVKGPGQLT